MVGQILVQELSVSVAEGDIIKHSGQIHNLQYVIHQTVHTCVHVATSEWTHTLLVGQNHTVYIYTVHAYSNYTIQSDKQVSPITSNKKRKILPCSLNAFLLL